MKKVQCLAKVAAHIGHFNVLQPCKKIIWKEMLWSEDTKKLKCLVSSPFMGEICGQKVNLPHVSLNTPSPKRNMVMATPCCRDSSY